MSRGEFVEADGSSRPASLHYSSAANVASPLKSFAIGSLIFGGLLIGFASLLLIAAESVIHELLPRSNESSWGVIIVESFLVLCFALGVMNVFSGVLMWRMELRRLSIMISALNMFLFPIGTMVGLFVILKLSDDAVREFYRSADQRRLLGTMPAASHEGTHEGSR